MKKLWLAFVLAVSTVAFAPAQPAEAGVPPSSCWLTKKYPEGGTTGCWFYGSDYEFMRLRMRCESPTGTRYWVWGYWHYPGIGANHYCGTSVTRIKLQRQGKVLATGQIHILETKWG